VPTAFDTRRYLTNFDSGRTGHLLTDVLVVGSGVAGGRAAIEAARFADVILISKAALDESVTRYAQGGIASAMSEDDSAQRHLDDTLRVGAGLNRRAAVDRVWPRPLHDTPRKRRKGTVVVSTSAGLTEVKVDAAVMRLDPEAGQRCNGSMSYGGFELDVPRIMAGTHPAQLGESQCPEAIVTPERLAAWRAINAALDRAIASTPRPRRSGQAR